MMAARRDIRHEKRSQRQVLFNRYLLDGIHHLSSKIDKDKNFLPVPRRRASYEAHDNML